jgi:magnesium-transporting ATPase (P-type)
MSILEEIPVALFMALGSWRLMKEGNKNQNSSLGSATIICTDKTGNTENKMSLNPYTLLANYTKRAMEYGRGKKSH